MGVGPAEHAGRVAESINSGAVYLWAMGQELLWLGEVLPAAADGDWQSYRTSGTAARNQIRQVLRIYRMLLSSDPTIAPLMRQVMSQFEPMVEEQSPMLARMLNQ